MTTSRPGAVASQQVPAAAAATLPARYETFLAGLGRPVSEARPWPEDPLRPRRLRALGAESHRFVQRTAAWLAGAGVGQFVAADVAGRPFRDAVHRVHPWARVTVFATDGPAGVVARSLLREASGDRQPLHAVGSSRPVGPTPTDLARAATDAELDPTRPVALYLLGTLQHIVDDRAGAALVRRLAAALAPGSFVVASHLTGDHPSTALDAAVRGYRWAGRPVRLRSRAEVAALLGVLTPVEPGVELLSAWHRDPHESPAPPPAHVPCWGMVGRVS
ncbi:MAG TPA: SAM-dependent methyltransferase [Kineosporiaceae bacterium]